MLKDVYKTTKHILVMTFFVLSVNAACPENCNSCDNSNLCISCKTGFWDLKNGCRSTCNENCLNKHCSTEDGFCTACKTGLYGVRCQENCNLCDDGLCALRDCAKGCKAGYHEYQDTIQTLCWPCSSQCRSCSNNSVCTVCNDGFYFHKYHTENGRMYVKCVQCPDATACIGYCSIQDCIQCQIQDDSELFCAKCNDGYRFNGEICIPNKTNCGQGCSTDCDSNGICPGSCSTGWTGEKCSVQCASRCLRCDKNNPNICYECKGDYYTTACDEPCNPSCAKETGKQTCNQNDGYCNNGCKHKFWGQFCNQFCPEGCLDDESSRVCDKDNGTCANGCVGGYTGEKCDTVVSKKSTSQSTAVTKMQTNSHVTTTTEIPTCVQGHENTDTKTIFITGYMSGVGTAIFVVIITAALYHLRRRYIAKKSKLFNEGNATDETSTYYNENAAETREPPIQLAIDANNYEILASNRNTEKVYSELESQAQQKKHSYYNLVAMK